MAADYQEIHKPNGSGSGNRNGWRTWAQLGDWYFQKNWEKLNDKSGIF